MGLDSLSTVAFFERVAGTFRIRFEPSQLLEAVNVDRLTALLESSL